jgi:hypothetical protein
MSRHPLYSIKGAKLNCLGSGRKRKPLSCCAIRTTEFFYIR